ncbi:MAG: helix-turn-helix transcriptional regulator [Clostridia bacterium]|nr:helix-turn-helix transcriptional regulator [Clostridia bacterium]
MAIYLGENIRRLRLEKGITQETLADFLGVTFQSVSRWEREEGYPDITLLPSIASFFGVSVDDLLGICEDKNEQKINEYIELYDNAKLKDLQSVLDEYEKAVKEFPGDFRILVRYMQLLQEVKIRNLSHGQVLSGEYKKTSEKISEIYNNIQKYCTVDSIRIWSKTVMILHLVWKYDCLCNREGKYQVYDEYLKQADEIANTLPAMCNSREIMANDRANYYATHKTALEELIFLLHNELFGYCFNYSPKDRITQYECLLRLLDLVYPDGDFGKNSFNRLYNLGHLGCLYQQTDDDKAIEFLYLAAEYAKELDVNPDVSEREKKFYNYGAVYRETTASQFMKTVMTEHFPLSDEFKEKTEFREIIDLLS